MTQRLVSVGDDFTLPGAVVVADANLPAASKAAAIAAKLDASEKGAVSGVAALDAGSKLLEANVPTRLGDAALTATILTQTAAPIAAAVAPALTAARLRIPRIPAAPVARMIPACKAGHAWVLGGASAMSNVNQTLSNLNSTEKVLLGNRSAKLVTNGLGNVEARLDVSITALDVTDKNIRIWVYVEGGINTIKPAFLDAASGANSSNVYVLGGVSDLSGFGVQRDRWNVLDIPLAEVGGVANLSAITSVRLIITDNGTPATIHLSGQGFTERAHTNLFPNGVLSHTADDSFGSQWSILRPAMDEFGMRGTLFPIIDQINAPGNYTMDQLLSFHYDYGWEVGAHATTGVKHGQGMQNMTQYERLTELEALRKWQDTYGFDSTSYAYPLGSRNVAVEKDVAQFFSTARSALISHIGPQYPSNSYSLQSINVGSQNSQITDRVTKIVNGKGMGSLCYHAIKESGGSSNDITTAQLMTILTTVANSGVTVLPMGEATRLLAA